jgi:leucyl-tRNA synthetase
VRDRVTVPAEASEDAIKSAALASENVQKYLEGKPPRKVIVVPGKLVSIVM